MVNYSRHTANNYGKFMVNFGKYTVNNYGKYVIMIK